MKQKKIIIMGAGGRDFFLFQRYFLRNNKSSNRVVAFTAAQIPGIDNRVYPARLAGPEYPDGIPIRPESELKTLISGSKEDGSEVEVWFAYSDVSRDHIMAAKNKARLYGASFVFGKQIYMDCMINPVKPVIAVTAIRTGCGKSAVSRYIGKFFKNRGLNPVLVRHPMPYFNLDDQVNDVQRFTSREDIDHFGCTFEEREEYEPIVDAGLVVYAGADYKAILEAAEKEADVIIWDGGNNDLPFYKPNLWVTVVDPFRVNNVIGAQYPHGYWNLKNADIVLINKTGTADSEQIREAQDIVKILNKEAVLLKTDLSIKVNDGDAKFLTGKSVIAVEDGPTVTHGGMSFGAATLAAKKYGAKLADPRPYLNGSLREIFVKYQHLWGAKILPCIGYSRAEILAMENTINAIPADLVLSGTPIDLGKVIKVNKPIVKLGYDLTFLSGEKRDYLSEARFRAEICAKICKGACEHN
jgi:predicted GTPase